MLNIAQYVCGPKKRTMGYNGLIRGMKLRLLFTGDLTCIDFKQLNSGKFCFDM